MLGEAYQRLQVGGGVYLSEQKVRTGWMLFVLRCLLSDLDRDLAFLVPPAPTWLFQLPQPEGNED